MQYWLIPLGCATNKADAERIAAMLERAGCTPAQSEEEADVVGVIACSIRQSAIDRIYSKIHKWNKRKSEKSLITIVSGCVLDADKKKFLKLFDIVLPLEEVPKLPELLQEYGAMPAASFWDITPKRGSHFKALVPIQNGCDKFCTYCAVPYTRGREVSRKSSEILAEVQQLVDDGYQQITLLGQNVNSYGLDKPGKTGDDGEALEERELSFAELLDRVGDIADNAGRRVWVHYTSPHPRDMTEEVYQVQAKHPSLAKYLNLPMQSGDSEVLKRMNRRYSIETYMEKLDMARRIMPDITVSTDIIVGFCGETEEEFEHTRQAVARGKFDLAFIAQYSPRPGAVAEKRFEDTVPKATKKERDVVLTADLAVVALENNQKLVGKVVPVLVESKSRKSGKMLGRTEGLKSVEFESSDESLIGQFVDIEITECDAWRFKGVLK